MVDRDRVLLDTPGRGRQAVVQVGVGGRGEGDRDRRLEAGAGLGKSFTDADGKLLAVGNSTIAEAGRERLLELAV